MNPTTTMQTEKTSRYTILDRETPRLKTILGRWESLLAMLFVVVFVANSIALPHFLDLYNLLDGTQNFSEKALIALPMALLIICREIDISVAGTLALSSVAMGLAKGAGFPAETLPLVALATGTVCGFLNGVLVTRFALPSIVVTIGTVSLFRGLASVVLGDYHNQNAQATLELGEDWRVDAIPDLLRAVRNLPGVEAARLRLVRNQE